jgi:hypothetical protein
MVTTRTHLSKVTVGTPNVAPNSAAKEPPKLCPVSQMLASGYIAVRFAYSPYIQMKCPNKATVIAGQINGQ